MANFPISALPNPSFPLVGDEVFPLVQGGITCQAPINAIDPYGLITDASALAADEFDDGVLDAAWVVTQPGSGAITVGEGNHKLQASCGATADLGSILRPLAGFGGAWADGVSIVEAQVDVALGKGLCRSQFCIADGTNRSTSQTMQVALGTSDSLPVGFYTFLGTADAPFGGGFVDRGFVPPSIRVRIVSTGAGTVKAQVSYNGAQWVDAAGADVAIGFVPTHVGFLFGSAVHGIFSSDYVRRIA